MSDSTRRRGASLATKILLGLLIGAALGGASNAFLGPRHRTLLWFADNVANTAGQIFLRLLFMVVVPLVFCSLVTGVAGLGDLRRLGRIGARTFGYFLLSTAVAATLGIALVNTFRPGHAVTAATAEAIRAEYGADAKARIEQGQKGTGFGIDTFLNIIPKNVVRAPAEDNMLALIFFAIMTGIGATFVPEERIRPFLGFLQGFYEVCVAIIRIAMRAAPYGVAGLVFTVTAKFGIAILGSLASYLAVVMGGLVIHQVVVLGFFARFLGGVSPRDFFRRSRSLMATAFSLSSSSATLPTTIRTAEDEFGVPPGIAGFVLPLGATMNMNGTALFEGVSVLFLAQVSGVELSVTAQITLVIFAVLTAVGAAGVPGGSLPLVALVLAQVGVKPEMLAIILGVDRIVDMARTVPNVTSDVICALWVARREKASGPEAAA